MIERRESARRRAASAALRIGLAPGRVSRFDAGLNPANHMSPPPAPVLLAALALAGCSSQALKPEDQAAVERFGRRRVVEMVGVLGYYSMLAILLRIYRVPAKTKN